MLILDRYAALAVNHSPQGVLVAVQQVLRLVPAAKYVAIIIFLLNAGGWPFSWHFRILSPLFEGFFRINLIKLRNLFAAKQTKKKAVEAWYEGQMQIGEHPFRKVWTRSSWVRPDQSDFNLHMSNSSYAEVLDAARLRLALSAFPNIFRCGGWVPLSATHFHFIREIPMLSHYEVRVSIGSFDEKWLWVVSRFVKPVSKGKSKSAIKSALKSAAETATATVIPSITVPATPLTNGAGTPLVGSGADTELAPNAVAQALLAREAARTTEADGAMLYTVTVEQFCFKQGRITVPPAVVLAANGFHAAPSASASEPPSSTGARTAKPPMPPHWPAVRSLTGSMRALAKFYAGGWKDVPAGERWWEDAFAACEEERKARLVPFVGAETSFEGTRSGLNGGLAGVRALRS
ncbi:hypothetical protein DFH07DRAFT_889281 [Mycena maculata]|uniref:Uncharacterized protein n=1 Tax=Mycena maculata TaxID=230809 RepID=A0AAD7N629_9AGAR|nr:hypothetical protein DFH07DRAFT_889281 [Mycena maculata]